MRKARDKERRKGGDVRGNVRLKWGKPEIRKLGRGECRRFKGKM